MVTRSAPASVGQRLLWFLDRYRGAGGALNCPMACRIRGPADDAALQQALNDVVAAHESLRTTFSGAGRDLLQVIAEPAPVPVRHVDLRDRPDARARADAELAADVRHRVDPSRAPLRVTVWHCSHTERLLALTMHHLVTDTWSCDVIFRDLARAYGRRTGVGGPAAPRAWQYAQFGAWQRREFAGPRYRRHDAYWARQLDGLHAPALPITAEPGAVRGRAAAYGFVPEPVAAGLRDVAVRERTTAFVVLLSAYQAVLSRVADDTDVAVATLFANRTRPELSATVGFLANMVVLRTAVGPDMTFLELVRRTRTTVLDALAHQAMPFHLARGRGTRSTGWRPDDVVFQLLSEAIDVRVDLGGVSFEGVVPDVPGRFDFELALMPSSGGYATKLYYTTDRVAPGWAQAFVDAYLRAVTALAQDPGEKVHVLVPDRVPTP